MLFLRVVEELVEVANGVPEARVSTAFCRVDHRYSCFSHSRIKVKIKKRNIEKGESVVVAANVGTLQSVAVESERKPRSVCL